MDHLDDRGRLKQILRARSVLRGEFTLASGKKSDIYVDCRLTTLCAEAMPLIGRLLLAAIREKSWNPRAVGGLTMGADPVVCALARESLESGSAIDGFLIRKEAKGHGRGRYLEGLTETAGVDCVILDDVCTTGGSTVTAIERAEGAGMNVLGAACVVDREQGGRQAVEARGCGFAALYAMAELLEPKPDPASRHMD